MATVIFPGNAVPGVDGDTFPCGITTVEALASVILSEPGRHQHGLGHEHGAAFEPEPPRSPDRTFTVPGWVGRGDIGEQQ